MAGVRTDALEASLADDAAEWLLSLPSCEPVSLQTALAGLPAARISAAGVTLADVCPVARSGVVPRDEPGQRFLTWVGQRYGDDVETTDSHVARAPREDDRRWFAMMAPGTRWMDYRADGSATLTALSALLRRVTEALEEDRGLEERLGASLDQVRRLARSADGSLSLRLLLETIEPMDGELEHHLLADAYLQKREGNHGDWLARLAPDRPSKTITSHIAKDGYSYVHPFENRSLSVREAARIQTFPDWFSFAGVGIVDAFRVIGNAVPPLLSNQLADRALRLLAASDAGGEQVGSPAGPADGTAEAAG